MVAPGGGEQERLAERVPAFGLAFEEEPADRLGAGGAARLAGGERGDAGAAERADQQGRLGRFARPLAALDRHEPAAQCLLPQIR